MHVDRSVETINKAAQQTVFLTDQASELGLTQVRRLLMSAGLEDTMKKRPQDPGLELIK